MATAKQIAEIAKVSPRTAEFIASQDELPAFGEWTIGDLRKAFDAVKDSEHWKNPIKAAHIKPEDLEITDAAIQWFTGTSIERVRKLKNGKLSIYAPGYYLGPCN